MLKKSHILFADYKNIYINGDQIVNQLMGTFLNNYLYWFFEVRKGIFVFLKTSIFDRTSCFC